MTSSSRIVKRKYRPMTVGRVLKNVLLLVLVVIQAIPVIWCFFLSLKTQYDIFNNPLALPNPPQWSNYTKALSRLRLTTMIGNTLFVAVITISIALFLTILSSYAIGRMQFGKGRLQKGFYMYFLTGIITPIFVLILPIYLMNVSMGTYDTLLALILPYLGTAAPMNTMIMVAAYKSMPYSLEEAAIIDGCKLFRMIFTIALPVIKPAIATVVILHFLGIWNDFPFASVMLTNTDNYTIALSVSQFKGRYSTNYEQTCAALTALIVPQIAVFAFFQKYIISGLTAGAVKG